jgi:hypothetical protein
MEEYLIIKKHDNSQHSSLIVRFHKAYEALALRVLPEDQGQKQILSS